MDAPNEFQPLIDEIFREKVLRARQESPGQKFVDGLTLFEEVLGRMRGGIKSQLPHLTADEIETELHRRIARVRQVEEHGLYSTIPPL